MISIAQLMMYFLAANVFSSVTGVIFIAIKIIFLKEFFLVFG